MSAGNAVFHTRLLSPMKFDKAAYCLHFCSILCSRVSITSLGYGGNVRDMC